MCKAQQQESPEAPIARVATLMWCWYGSNLDIRVQLLIARIMQTEAQIDMYVYT